MLSELQVCSEGTENVGAEQESLLKALLSSERAGQCAAICRRRDSPSEHEDADMLHVAVMLAPSHSGVSMKQVSSSSGSAGISSVLMLCQDLSCCSCRSSFATSTLVQQPNTLGSDCREFHTEASEEPLSFWKCQILWNLFSWGV